MNLQVAHTSTKLATPLVAFEDCFPNVFRDPGTAMGVTHSKPPVPVLPAGHREQVAAAALIQNVRVPDSALANQHPPESPPRSSPARILGIDRCPAYARRPRSHVRSPPTGSSPCERT